MAELSHPLTSSTNTHHEHELTHHTSLITHVPHPMHTHLPTTKRLKVLHSPPPLPQSGSQGQDLSQKQTHSALTTFFFFFLFFPYFSPPREKGEKSLRRRDQLIASGVCLFTSSGFRYFLNSLSLFHRLELP